MKYRNIPLLLHLNIYVGGVYSTAHFLSRMNLRLRYVICLEERLHKLRFHKSNDNQNFGGKSYGRHIGLFHHVYRVQTPMLLFNKYSLCQKFV